MYYSVLKVNEVTCITQHGILLSSLFFVKEVTLNPSTMYPRHSDHLEAQEKSHMICKLVF